MSQGKYDDKIEDLKLSINGQVDEWRSKKKRTFHPGTVYIKVLTKCSCQQTLLTTWWKYSIIDCYK